MGSSLICGRRFSTLIYVSFMRYSLAKLRRAIWLKCVRRSSTLIYGYRGVWVISVKGNDDCLSGDGFLACFHRRCLIFRESLHLEWRRSFGPLGICCLFELYVLSTRVYCERYYFIYNRV